MRLRLPILPAIQPTWQTTCCILFFFNDTATTEIYTLSLHDALPISIVEPGSSRIVVHWLGGAHLRQCTTIRSEEHTSELQSLTNLVCRLLPGKNRDRRSARAAWSSKLRAATNDAAWLVVRRPSWSRR